MAKSLWWLWVFAVIAFSTGCGVADEPLQGATKDTATHDSGEPDAAHRITPPCSCDTSDDRICVHSVCQESDGKCAPKPRNEGAPCEDGDPCTVGDLCAGGSCKTGSANTCQCATTLDCAALEDGDKCNGTMYCDLTVFPFVCKVAPSSVVTCDPADDDCAATTCVADTGECVVTARPDGNDCDDGDACTVSETCAAGKCGGGANKCTCTSNLDCAAFDDEDHCNGALFCDKDAKDDAGKAAPKCVPNPATVVSCPKPADGSCTVKSCEKSTGLCKDVAAASTTTCDDGDSCTAKDHCLGGLCVGAR